MLILPKCHRPNTSPEPRTPFQHREQSNENGAPLATAATAAGLKALVMQAKEQPSPLPAASPTYPPDVVRHAVHAAEHPPAPVLRLMANAVLLAGETATTRGAAPLAAGIGERASL
jgi:hypothetical protein